MPEAPTAPPPAAPASPSPFPRSPSPSVSDFDKTFSDLEEPTPTPDPTPSPDPKAAPETKPEPTKGPDKDPLTGKFVPKAEPKPDATPKSEPKPDSKTPPEPADEYTPPTAATPTQLRNFAFAAGRKARKFESEMKQMQGELQKLKSAPHGDTTALTEQLASANKKIQEYENEARLTRYERSDEYRTKYEAPYQNAVKQAYSDVKELLVSEPDPTNPETPKERQAVASDFDEVYNLPLGPATKLAKQKFGDSAFIVLQHRTAIKQAAKAAMDAVEANKGKATEYEQQQTAQQKLREEANSQMFTEAVSSLQQKYPDWFAPKDGNTEWNDALAKGISMADMAFDPDARKALTPQQNCILDAQIHMRSAAFAPMKAELTKLRAQVKQLESDIAKARGSAPGETKPSGPAPESGKRKTWQEEFDEKVT